MQKYQDSILQKNPVSNNLIPMSGAVVTIANTSGGSNQMYSDNGITPIASTTSDSNGLISFYANDGTYTLTATGGGGTTTRTIYLEDNATEAATLSYTPAGTGAVVSTVQTKLRESVSVKDFGAKGDGVTDDTASFTTALTAAFTVYVPDGTYIIDNLRYVRSGNRIVGSGYKNAILKQKTNGNPAINCLSDVTTGQLIGVGLLNVGITGSAAPTVSAVIVSATAPYVVNKSEFDYIATSTYRALELVCTGGNEIYSNKFKVDSYATVSTAFITKGTYNSYDLIAERCADGTALNDDTIDGYFNRVVSDGQQAYGGQNCSIIRPTVETIYGTAQYGALLFNGYNHTVLGPTLTDVAQAKISGGGAGMVVYNSHTIIQPRVWGANYPTYPFDLGANPNSIIIGGDVLCTFKLEAYLSASTLAKLTLVGNVSTFSVKGSKFNAPLTYTGTAATYTVDANKSTLGLDYIIQSGATAGLTLTLPSGAEYIGRELKISTRVAQTVVSASANVTPMTGGASTAILAATIGKWAIIQCDSTGTNWNIIANN